MLSAAAEFQYTPTCDDYKFLTADRTGSKQEVELAIIIIKMTVKVAINGGLFSLRSGYAKWVLISTQSTN